MEAVNFSKAFLLMDCWLKSITSVEIYQEHTLTARVQVPGVLNDQFSKPSDIDYL